MEQHWGTALVTGASTGIGAVYAERLARRGYDLVIVARSRSRLDELAARITDETGRSVEVLVADLGDHAGMAAVETKLRTDQSITFLVNNAGVGATTPLLQSDVDAMEAMITLNVTALTRLTYAAAPALVARGGGTIVNISSVVAVAPEFLNGVYAASKAFVLAFTRSLHNELAEKGIQLQAVLPGGTATDFWVTAGQPREKMDTSRLMSATDMVDAALAGLDQGELVTLPSLPDVGDWNAFEAARRALMPNLSRPRPADRYGVAR